MGSFYDSGRAHRLIIQRDAGELADAWIRVTDGQFPTSCMLRRGQRDERAAATL